MGKFAENLNLGKRVLPPLVSGVTWKSTSMKVQYMINTAKPIRSRHMKERCLAKKNICMTKREWNSPKI